MKSSEVCIKTRSPPASLPVQGQVTKHITVKWPIVVRDGQTIKHLFVAVIIYPNCWMKMVGLDEDLEAIKMQWLESS